MIDEKACLDSVVGEVVADDLLREVYCLLGCPIDAIRMPMVIRRIELAAAMSLPFFLSTPNLNFLVNSQLDPEFRESLLLSDLCIADGISIVWSARLIGIPIKDRVAGSDILPAFKAGRSPENPLKLFLFGGAEGVASAASRALNARPSGVYCVGLLYPGLGTVDELSCDDVIDTINSSGAEFLVTSLGSKKGQLWLKNNHSRLQIPVRAHLGASLNFEAGRVKRAPRIMQQLGLEWLWRIMEEPFLWRRYWNDGRMLLRLLYTRILPLALYQLLLKNKWDSQEMFVTQFNNDTSVIIKIFGPGIRQHVSKIIPAFREAIAMKKRTVIDFSNTCAVDTRFLGLLLMLRKNLRESVSDLVLVGLSAELKRIFHLNGLDFLLAARQYDEPPQQMAANLTATESQEDITTTALSPSLGQIGPSI
jgi:N-acetylglucosaminyldiphosphoundecaprenol N-acetyl-beta-D-mannosaminyltransferase